MSRYRKYALTEYPGTRLNLNDLKLKANRVALVGKRIGFDLKASSFSHYGTVTGSVGREIEIDGSLYAMDEFEQIAVLTKQEPNA